MIAIPTLGNPLRRQLFSSFNVKNPNKPLYFFVTAFNLAFTAIVAFLFPDVVDFVSLVGGTFVTIMSITIPGACYYKLKG